MSAPLHLVDITDGESGGDQLGCATCGREACEDHMPGDRRRSHAAGGFPDSELEDASAVVREGMEIARRGIAYVVEGLIPQIGGVGFVVAYAKVGKTTFGQALAGAVAAGTPFIGRETTAVRVLALAAEDPPEFTAYLARHHVALPHGRLTFRRQPLILDRKGLQRVVDTVLAHGYGLVLIASWQAVVRGLIRDENDNAGAVGVVENVKAAARLTGVPWLIDAHAGKGEDQQDEADPSKAMRGASAAAGAADYTLSLRYANGAFGTRRRLSGKGRFVALEPTTIDYDTATGAYALVGDTKSAGREAMWDLLRQTGALDTTPRSATEVAFAAGLRDERGRVSTTHRRQIAHALRGRPDIGIHEELRRGQKTALYRLLQERS